MKINGINTGYLPKNQYPAFSAGKIVLNNTEKWPTDVLLAFAKNDEFKKLAKVCKKTGKDLVCDYTQDIFKEQVIIKTVNESIAIPTQSKENKSLKELVAKYSAKDAIAKLNSETSKQKEIEDRKTALKLIKDFNDSLELKKSPIQKLKDVILQIFML